jgi:hypothetical protein
MLLNTKTFISIAGHAKVEATKTGIRNTLKFRENHSSIRKIP